MEYWSNMQQVFKMENIEYVLCGAMMTMNEQTK